MRIVPDPVIETLVAIYRQAATVALDHADHGCLVAYRYAERAATLAVALDAIGVSEDKVNGPELGARIAAHQAPVPVAVTVLDAVDQPPAPEAPPITQGDADTFDVSAWLDQVIGSADQDGGQR